jgi:ParB family chromosome partitioning protein
LEILAGHNRINAAKTAGKATIPAIVLEGISDDEAMVYVVETNLMQRSFADMNHSEKAAVIAMHHSKMFSQGKRNDILEQLKALENPGVVEASAETTAEAAESALNEVESDEGQRTDEKIGVMYSLSRNTIARYLRIHRLTRELKAQLDNGFIPFLAAVEVSFMFLENQHQLAECLENGYKINVSKAVVLRDKSKAKTLDLDIMKSILTGQTAATENKPRRVKINGELYSRYFKPEQSAKEIEDIVEEALTMYFGGNKGAVK